MTNLVKQGGGFLDTLFMSRSARVNRINRDIIAYKPNAAEAFVRPEDGVGNVLVSGGNPVVRNSIVCAQIECALANHFPVVVLHEGNYLLEENVRSRFSPSGRYAEIGFQSPAFEPMYGLSGLEISNEIVQAAAKDFDMKFIVKYYMEGLTAFMSKLGKATSFHMFATCPHMTLFDKVDDAQMKGRISDTEAQEIKSKLMMGQSESMKLESVLANFQMETDQLLWKRGNAASPVNVYSAIKEQRILCFDLVAVSNRLLMNMIIFQLKLALTKGLPYVLVIDSLPANCNEQYQEFLKMPSSKAAVMISSEDLYGMFGGDDKLFDTYVGASRISFILSHKSGNSAKKWAEAIGQYDAWIESYSKNFGSQTNPKEIFNSHNYGTSTSTSKNREYKVKPEEISGMGSTEAYIISLPRQETAHIQLII